MMKAYIKNPMAKDLRQPKYRPQSIPDKKKPKPVLKPGTAEQSDDNLTVEMVSYYKIPVDYEIKGNFLGYIKFKRAVSKQKKMLNFDKETISVVQNDSTGAIVAKGEVTIVGMPDEFF